VQDQRDDGRSTQGCDTVPRLSEGAALVGGGHDHPGDVVRYVVGGSPALDELGGELLVCDAAGQTVHRLTGEARRRFEVVVAGDPVELPHDDVTAALEASGLVVAVGDSSEAVVGMSRRRALAFGAAAAAAGVVTVVLPTAAAAQSAQSEVSEPTSVTTTTTTTAPPSAPLSRNIDWEVSGAEKQLGILWLQGAYPTSFTYSYVVEVGDFGSPEGEQVFSGSLSSTTSATDFTILGNLGAGGERTVWLTMTSDTPSPRTKQNIFYI